MNFNPMKHRIPFIKRWLPSARKAWARVFWPAGYKIVRTGPIHMLVNWNNFIDRQIAFYDDYEAAQWACMEKHLRALSPVDLFIDVGANIGFYSLRIAKLEMAARVIAFEPDTRNTAQLGANILINGLMGRIETRIEAVTDRNGPLSFVPAPDKSTGQSHVGEGGVMVPGICIDDFLGDTKNQTIVLKIDIERHETAVIEGMSNILSTNLCWLQIECFAENLPKLKAAMDAHGYSIVHEIGDDRYFAK